MCSRWNGALGSHSSTIAGRVRRHCTAAITAVTRPPVSRSKT